MKFTTEEKEILEKYAKENIFRIESLITQIIKRLYEGTILLESEEIVKNLLNLRNLSRSYSDLF